MERDKFVQLIALDKAIKELTKERDALVKEVKSGAKFADGEKSKKLFTNDSGSVSLRKSVRTSWDMDKLVSIVKENKIPCKIQTVETVDIAELTELGVDGEYDTSLLEPAMKQTEVVSLVVQAKDQEGEEK